MSKRKTKEQKILANLKRLQTGQQNDHNNQYESKTTDLKTSHAYVKKDLLKILILATLAIGIQIVLSLLINNGKLKLPF